MTSGDPSHSTPCIRIDACCKGHIIGYEVAHAEDASPLAQMVVRHFDSCRIGI